MVMNNKDGIIHSLDTRTRISIVDDSQVTTSLLGSYCDAIRYEILMIKKCQSGQQLSDGRGRTKKRPSLMCKNEGPSREW